MLNFFKSGVGLVLAVVIVLAVLLGGVLIAKYNGFVTRSANADAQWAQVETQYQRRYDLIPNLVESVKGLMDQETEVFTALADARSKYAGAASPDEKAAAATQVDTALARLLVVMEAYPELRSSEAVTTLMTQLEGTENRISVERTRFNDAVQEYNIAVNIFPSSVFAKIFGFAPRSYFTPVPAAAEAPQVQF